MAAKKGRRLSTRRTRMQGALTLQSQEYPFVLHRQAIPLGEAGSIQYYSMLLSDLRGADPTREISNFRSCIGYWWAAMHELGLQGDWEQQRHFVLAICYALVNRCKSLQDVYLDALPRPDSIDPESLSVPEEIQGRIRDIIDRRDRFGVKMEFDRALAVYQPSREDLVGFAKAFQTWTDKGVNAYRLSGEEGIIGWLAEIDYWLHKYRKRCPPRVRAFVNFFSYQAKVSFYTCYANFWAHLLPWLKENRDLDELSTRLLCLWHHQNQPVEIPHGKTVGGIWYPTRRGVRRWYPRRSGIPGPAGQIVVSMPRIGTEVLPDVFCGQILALHPLTWFLFADAALREVAGRFFASEEYEVIANGQDAENCPRYWELLGAILTATHLYRIARDAFENRRGVREQGGDAVLGVSRDETPPSVHAFLDDYFASQHVRCSCGAAYSCDAIESAAEGRSTRQVPVTCTSCGRHDLLEVTEAEIRRFLLGDSDSSF